MASIPRKLLFQPGVFSEESQLAAKGRWWRANMVRWRMGQPEKFGGWVRYGAQDAVGVPRSMLAYTFLTGDGAIAIGTSDRLMISKGGVVSDITPVRAVIGTASGFTSTAGSALVRIDFPSPHGAKVGDWLSFPTFTLGGISIGIGTDGYGFYRVVSVLSGTALLFEAQEPAITSVGPGGGARDVTVLYPVGPTGAVAGRGWGTGGWSRGGWGSAAAMSAVAVAMRYWSLDHWGERLLTVPSGGPLFTFAPSAGGAIIGRATQVVNTLDGQVARVDVTAGGSGYVTPPTVTIAAPGGGGATATAVANLAGDVVSSIDITSGGSGYAAAPLVSFSGGGGGSGAAATAALQPIRSPSLVNGYVLVGATERHAIILGSGDLGDDSGFDPMLIRYSDRDDYSDYLADGVNSAGFLRAQEGSRLVAGVNLSLMALIWSDTALYQMRFLGSPSWYALDVLGTGCGLVGPGAFAISGGMAFWMGASSFWTWRGGAPQQIPCSMQSEVFDNLLLGQASRVTCGVNAAASEILFFYPSTASVSGECDRMVVLNIAEGTFYGGEISRTVWLDQASGSRPVAADATGRLFQQETGSDAVDQPMGEWCESGFVDEADGLPFSMVERLVPDFARLSGGLAVYVTTQGVNGDRERGPFAIGPGTRIVGCRSRGRALAIRIEGIGVGGDWRLGAMRAEVAGVGGR